MKIEYGTGQALLTGASGCVSDETLTMNQCHWLAHQMWLLAQTTQPIHLREAADKMHNIFAALVNDTSAIVLHVPESEDYK